MAYCHELRFEACLESFVFQGPRDQSQSEQVERGTTAFWNPISAMSADCAERSRMSPRTVSLPASRARKECLERNMPVASTQTTRKSSLGRTELHRRATNSRFGGRREYGDQRFRRSRRKISGGHALPLLVGTVFTLRSLAEFANPSLTARIACRIDIGRTNGSPTRTGAKLGFARRRLASGWGSSRRNDDIRQIDCLDSGFWHPSR